MKRPANRLPEKAHLVIPFGFSFCTSVLTKVVTSPVLSEFAQIQHPTLVQSLESLTFGNFVRLTSRHFTLGGVVIAGSVPVSLRTLRVPVNAHLCRNVETAK